MSKFHLAAIAASVSLLVACGGGGGGTATTPAPTPVAKAEGVYSGTIVSGGVAGAFHSIVLEDDSIWAIYGVAGTGGSLLVAGFVAATGTSSNGSFNVTGKDYGYTSGVLNTTLAGTYVPGVSVTGTASAGAGSTFSGTTAALTGYNYNTPATVSSIVGTWTGSNLFSQAVTVAVTSAGTFTGTTAGTCTFTGTVTPRATGKNIFNVTLQQSSSVAACGTAAGLSAQGIGVASTLSSGKMQLIIPLVNADKTIGTVAFVTK